MTAIAGVVEGERVYIGGDSAGVGGLSLQTRSDPKVFALGEFVIGYTTSFRMGQLLQYQFTPPTPLEGEHGMAYMVRQFIPAVKRVLKQHGFETTDQGREEGGTFLVGHRGQLYEIESDYQVARVRQSYHACGCGTDLALGSLFTTQQKSMPPKKRIRLALAAAQEFSAGVREPFTVVSTRKQG